MEINLSFETIMTTYFALSAICNDTERQINEYRLRGCAGLVESLTDKLAKQRDALSVFEELFNEF